MEWNKLVDIW